MAITTKEYLKTLKIVERLYEHVDEGEMRRDIAKPLLGVLKADYFASFRWDSASESYGEAVFLNMDDKNIQDYSEYYQYHDPITRRLARYRKATLVDEVMPHTALKKTEFFNDFLLNDGLYCGVNLHLYHQLENIGDFRIWRHQSRPCFDENACEILDILKPHLIQATKNIKRIRELKGPGISSSELSLRLKASYQLTNRECDVTKLLLDGEKDSVIANRLNIGICTVRTHVKNIFNKTGVNSRNKLKVIEV